MPDVPVSIKQQIAKPQPNINDFLNQITGKAKPKRVHLAELFADQEIMQWITEDVLGKKWVPLPPDAPKRPPQMEQHLLTEIEYWYRMGYDYMWVNAGFNFQINFINANDTAGDMSHEKRTWSNSTKGPIQSWNDFEKYPWPQITDENFWTYPFVAKHLPEGMGILACPLSGFLEIPMDMLVGFESLSMMMYDQPDLLKAIFDKVQNIIVESYKRILPMDKIAGFFQGDDMGFRTGTLFSPDFLKQYSLPGHKIVADLVHAQDKVYFLHSCGNIYGIMDYLIDEVGIDAKQSYEDVILPVEEAYKRYSSRIGILGGLDVDLLGRGDVDVVRKRIKEILKVCDPNGRYALGSGNTVANYCKKENVLAMFDEAFKFSF